MITTPINSYSDLVKERKRLKKEIAHYELKLKDNIVALEQSLKPANIAVDFAHKIVEPPHEGILVQGVKNVVGGLASTLFAKYSWPVRFALTAVTKNVASKYVNEQAPTIVGFVSNLLRKNRERKLLRKNMAVKTATVV